MMTWTYLLIALISCTCISALPARQGESDEEVNQGDPLLFEPQQNSEENQGQELVPEGDHQNAELMQQAAEQNIGRDAPESHGEIGSKTGDEVAHGEDGDAHGEAEDQQETKHVNTGALSDDFVHNMMHDGNEDHEAEDEEIRKGKPADIRDVAKMDFSEEELKGIDNEGLKDPYVGEPVYEDQEHGPAEPNKELHGVLMHGDVVAGKEYDHVPEVKESQPMEHASVVIQEVGQAGDKGQVIHIPEAPPRTKDTEELIHGEGEDHTHEHAPSKEETRGTDRVLTENFMHDLMHGNSEDHDHDDQELKKSKVVRPRDLLNLGLDKDMLKGLDLEKMIKEDMEDYNRYIAEKGGDEESVWNIFNSFQFRYFKYGENIDDISSRQPPVEEWDDSVVSRPQQMAGEDSIEHMMESVGKDNPHQDVHNLQQRQKAEMEKDP